MSIITIIFEQCIGERECIILQKR